MKYDLLVTDGEVLDPAAGLKGSLDVGISGGKPTPSALVLDRPLDQAAVTLTAPKDAKRSQAFESFEHFGSPNVAARGLQLFPPQWNLGLNPAVDKKFIRIVLPELSEERRIEFTKVVKKMAEDGRIAIRHVRRDAIEHLKKETKDGLITEDDLKHAEKEVQRLTDQYIAKIDGHLTHKEKEIMTV